ncbi:uncharacterized protein HaLaN_11324 [Haematococcus lacustris]|uniref:Uncharacterized protein n=1 Tax=Haematococcus lacustris TaxID=44745 RepID=A0A699Z004_HAELA|nr:uncharacterized protein HaLaN_11324 [Haematococcus lacustris]
MLIPNQMDTTQQRAVKERLRTYVPRDVLDSLLDSSSSLATDNQDVQQDFDIVACSNNTMWARISAKRSQRAKEQELKDSAFKASVQRKQAATDAAREAAFQQDFADVLQGLDAGNSTHHVMGDTQYSLEHKRKVVAQKQGQAAEYLHATNTKLGVFRDVIIEEDYNPQAAHNHTIQIPTGWGCCWGWEPVGFGY